jgi:hypothetical protein
MGVPYLTDPSAYATSQGQALYDNANAAAVQLQADVAKAQGQAASAYQGVTKGDASGVVALGTGIAKGMSPGLAKTAVEDAVNIAEGGVEGAAILGSAAWLASAALGTSVEALWASIGIASASVPVIGTAIGACVAACVAVFDAWKANGLVYDPTYSTIAQQLMASVPLPLEGLPHDPTVDASGCAQPTQGSRTGDLLAAWRFSSVNIAYGVPQNYTGRGFQVTPPATLAACLAEFLGGQAVAQAALARALRWCPAAEGQAGAGTPGCTTPGVSTSPVDGSVTGVAAGSYDDGGFAWGLRLVPLAYATAGMPDAAADALALQYLLACAWAWDNAPDGGSSLPPGLAYKIGQLQALQAQAHAPSALTIVQSLHAKASAAIAAGKAPAVVSVEAEAALTATPWWKWALGGVIALAAVVALQED